MTQRMSIGKALAWMSVAQLLGVILQFGAQVVLARILSLHDAGIYAVAVAVSAVLSLFLSAGLQALIVREKTLTPDILATVFTVNLLMSAGLAVAMVALGYAGAAFLGDPGVRRVLAVLALVPLFAIPSFVPSAVLERDGRFREIAIATTFGSIGGAGTTVAMALNGWSYMSGAYGQCANGLIFTLYIVVAARRLVTFRLGLKSWRRVADFAIQMLAVSGVSNLCQRLSDIVLGRVLGLSALGLYSRASNLNGLIWSNLHLLAGRIMLVDFAELHRNGHSLRERYIQTVDVLTVCLWPVFAGFAIVAPAFIAIVFGERWVAAARPLAFLSLASMALVSITMTYEIFAATGELRTQTRIEFIRAGFGLAVFVAACFVSLEAAAAARLIEALFSTILYRPYLNRMTDTTFADFVPVYRRSVALTVLACAPAGAIMAWWNWSSAVPIVPLIVGIIAGGALWAGALAVLRHPLLDVVRGRRAQRADLSDAASR